MHSAMTRYRNATHAFAQMLRDIRLHGEELSVRGKSCSELRNRTIVLERPCERCIVTPGRMNDIFITIAETMWVLAGRNDLGFLQHYLSRARDYSDDGSTWRAAYGPRLRRLRGGTDQLMENLRLLKSEPLTRRSVATLFDPTLDFIESKDIPCTNWIHWLVRQDKLHMNIAVRSNDIIWGFSGINTFEWSVVHELMSGWLGLAVGEQTFFISSLHLYKHHYDRADYIIEKFPGVTCYEYGAKILSPTVGSQEFDKILEYWFEVESKLRKDPDSADAAITNFPDPLFGVFLKMLRLKNLDLRGCSESEQQECLATLPSETDLSTAAYEFFYRQGDKKDHIKLPSNQQQYWSHYCQSPSTELASQHHDFWQAIRQLHTEKSAAYGDSWKRRGEQVGILGNIARKVDRLEMLNANTPATHGENLLDTAVDLLVYSLKYQTFLADLSPAIAQQLFGESNIGMSNPFSEGDHGFELLLDKTILVGADTESGSLSEAIRKVSDEFQQLELCFPSNAPPKPEIDRLQYAQRLSRAALHGVVACRSDMPTLINHFITSHRGI